MSSIIVYSQPGCFKCSATIHYLNKLGLSHQVIDVTQDVAAKKYIESLGYKVTPVVQVDDTLHWSDFRISRLEALAASA